jgi:hypothetical protein
LRGSKLAHGKTVKQQKADAKKLIDGLYGRPIAKYLAKKLVDIDPLNIMYEDRVHHSYYTPPPMPPTPPMDPMFRRRDGRQEVFDRTMPDPVEAVMEVINNPDITITPALVKAINDPDMIMTPGAGLVKASSPSGRDVIRSSGQFRNTGIPLPTKRTRKKTKMDRTMSKCLKMANSKLRNKNGKLKKGKTMSDVMKMAHRLCKKS